MRYEGIRIVVVAIVLFLLPSGNTMAQNVQYSGKLRIGFGDADNNAGIPLDSGFPRCGDEPLPPSAPNKTFETLLVNARGTQVGTGPGAELVFNAVGAGLGGAQLRTLGTCRSELATAPGTRIRSLTRSSEARWPSNLGSYTSMISVLTSPATPIETYRLSAGGGIGFPGTTLMTGVPVQPSDPAGLTLTKGANHFGGGAPVQARLNVNFGLLEIGTFGTIAVPGNYGSLNYFKGGPKLDPLPIGDEGTTSIIIPTFGTIQSNPAGLLLHRSQETVAYRTPGGSTQNQHGLIRTLGGGNTMTPSGTFMMGPSTTFDCVAGIPSPCPAIASNIEYRAALFAWTTGRVRITDMHGDFSTIRSASGFDIAATGPSGTTRQIQLVSPWTAAYAPTGVFGLPFPSDVLSGVAILTLNVIPVPEPSGVLSLATGALMLFIARKRSA